MAHNSADSSVTRKLNMDHAFMKSIVRNQIDRDQYDKEVTFKKQNGDEKTGVKQKKPDLLVYNPPHRKKNMSVNDGNSQDGEILFRLEYEDETGWLHNLPIYKDEDLLAKIESFGASVGLDSSLLPVLYSRVSNEFNRLSK